MGKSFAIIIMVHKIETTQNRGVLNRGKTVFDSLFKCWTLFKIRILLL